MAKMTKAQKKVGKVMREYKEGTLHSGKKGPVVKSRKQAIAIALSEAGKARPRKYADGGMVDVAAPPIGITSLSSTPAAPQSGPYMQSSDYGSQQGPAQSVSTQPEQVLTTRNRLTGSLGTVGGPVQGFAKGGMVKKPRGCGKAIKGLTRGKVY
jgi:hypothetical protein